MPAGASPETAPPPLALTMGEPGGTSAEITVKAWRALKGGGPVFFLIDDPARLQRLDAPVRAINTPHAAHGAFRDALPVLPLGATIDARPGKAEPCSAPHVIASIEKAVALTLAGEASGIVTNPIQKASLIEAGFGFPGHTEFLAALTKDTAMQGGLTRGPVMMLAGPYLKTVPATIHLPLAQAVKSLTCDTLIRTGRIVAESLKTCFDVDAPRLAFSGLNPHAGESGALGKEDQAIIVPAIEHLKREGVDARGPLPADTMFHEDARSAYDAAICMYHDQALIPVKTLHFHDAVNVTLGLPIIRTSPDHGTALDIAGKGLARADSLIAAIHLAAQMAARQAAQRSAS